MSELEIEAKNQGRKISGVQLEVAENGHDEQLKCNYCRISIGDLHRSCSNCSYILFLFCCREIRKGSLLPGATAVSCRYPNGTRAYKDVGKTPDGVKMKIGKLHSLLLAEQRDKNADDNISCPPSEHGGCGDDALMRKTRNTGLQYGLAKLDVNENAYFDADCIS